MSVCSKLFAVVTSATRVTACCSMAAKSRPAALQTQPAERPPALQGRHKTCPDRPLRDGVGLRDRSGGDEFAPPEQKMNIEQTRSRTLLPRYYSVLDGWISTPGCQPHP